MISDFEAPSGPPPPADLPAGWLAKWNPKYETWFFVNKFTKKSQWEKPTAACYPPDEDLEGSPPGPPPAYNAVGKPRSPSDLKSNPFAPNISEDERLARQLQAEEDARVRGLSRSPVPPMGGGAAASYASTPLPPGSSVSPGYPDQQQLPREEDGSRSRGLLGKLFGGGGSRQRPSYGQPAYGSYPPQQGGSYYGQPQQGYGGEYAQQQQQPQKRHGLGTAGGAALGLGAGLVGGMLLEHAIDDHNQEEYDQGFQNGEMDNNYGGGDDYGGNDYGGNDFGGGDDLGGGF